MAAERAEGARAERHRAPVAPALGAHLVRAAERRGGALGLGPEGLKADRALGLRGEQFELGAHLTEHAVDGARVTRGLLDHAVHKPAARVVSDAQVGVRVDGLDLPHHLIGGADEAGELDAKRAINQGTRLAAAM